jgi:hypothetical protein
LKNELPDYERWIKELDEGIELKGYVYKSHYLAIKRWKNKEKEFTKDTPKHDRHVNPGEDDLMERLMKGGK